MVCTSILSEVLSRKLISSSYSGCAKVHTGICFKWEKQEQTDDGELIMLVLFGVLPFLTLRDPLVTDHRLISYVVLMLRDQTGDANFCIAFITILVSTILVFSGRRP